MLLSDSSLAKALNIDDLRKLAHRRVPRFALAYLEGGAEDHISLNWNRRVFDQWRFVPDTLVNAEQRSLATTLLGRPARLPCVVAPTGFNGMLWHQADVLLAEAARRAGIPFTLSTMSTASIEEVAAGAKGVDLWFQLYMMKDQGITDDLLARARAVGCKTLVFTTDCVHFGNRESERRCFRAPMKLTLSAMFNAACHPAWFSNVILRRRGIPGFGNLERYFSPEDKKNGRGSNFVAAKMDFSLNWNHLRDLRKKWSGQLVVKGILHAEDARRARDFGADAIVLTNHGGRQLDGTVSPMEVLQEIRAAVNNDTGILIDSGFRRGTDIAKALALGADAVMLGRPLLYGAAAGGLEGIERGLAIIASELDRTLAQIGVTVPAALKPRHLRAPLS